MSNVNPLQEEIRALLWGDRGLEARELARANDAPKELMAEVDDWLAHTKDMDAYSEFYTKHRGVYRTAREIPEMHKVITRLGKIREAMEDHKPKSILDLGCFDGWALLNLCQHFDVEGCGVDLDGHALNQMMQNVQDLGMTGKITAAHGSIESTRIQVVNPKMDRFDAIVITELLEHVIDPAKIIAVAEQHLAPGGRIYITTPASPVPHFDNEHEAREHLRCFGEAGLLDLIPDRVVEAHDVWQEGSHKEQLLIYRKPKTAIYVNPVAGGWRPDDEKSYGGSEEGVVNLAAAMQAGGHDVHVYANLSDSLILESWKDVRYHLHDKWEDDSEWDLVISVKYPRLFDRPINARKKILWTTDPETPGEMTHGRLAQIDHIVAISDYHRSEILANNPHIDPDKVIAFPYGVQDAFMRVTPEGEAPVVRHPQRVLYASSFDRGLEPLLQVWPIIRAEVPQAELHIWYGWELADRIAGERPDYQAWKGKMLKLMEQPGVTFRGRTTIEDPTPYLEASVWAYPCIGGERFCITAVKAQSLGAVPVVVPKMALEQTVQYGLKVKEEEFIPELIALLKDEKRQREIRDEMTAAGVAKSWPEIHENHWAPLWRPALHHPVGPSSSSGESAYTSRPTLQTRPGLDIFMLTAGMPHQGDTLENRDLGGSETASICMARELAKIGHRVSVFTNCETPGEYDGVLYRPIQDWEKLASGSMYDVAIVQRMPQAFSQRLTGKLNWLWLHDLGIRSQVNGFRPVLWNVDRALTVSKWHAEQHAEAMGCPPETYWPTRNGIDLHRFPEAGTLTREKKRIIYSARPERGLDRLLVSVLPKILERDPEVTLRIFGYDNTTPEMQGFYDQLKAKAAEFGDAVEWVGAVTKERLYKEYATAGAYVYPTPGGRSPDFAEVSCITAMECMASGLPFVSFDVGALPETLHPDAGILIQNHETHDADDRMADAVVGLLGDEARWQAVSDAGRSHAQGLSWKGVAEAWTEEMYHQLAEKNQDPDRLARHFIRRSDIIAAEKVAKNIPDERKREEVTGRIQRHWGMLIGDNETAREHYEKIGHERPPTFGGAIQEPRLGWMVEWLKAHPNVKRILDVGCAHGEQSIHLANASGCEVVGVDLDKNHIAQAREWAADESKCPGGNARFYTVEQFREGAASEEKFDAVIFFDTLQNVTEPGKLVDDYEGFCKPDGHVLLTVPYGPWEYMVYEPDPYRRNVWEFDLHDLRDMFAAKREMTTTTMRAGLCTPLDQPIGWHIVEYQPNGKPCGEINIERKIELQAPRQTVSATLIAGTDPNAAPPEDTLHWCLRSIRHVVDEVIIGDCGGTLSPEAHRIIEQHVSDMFDIRIVKVSNPQEAGFETPRNEVLNLASMDWVLWIDTDERIIGQEQYALQKYLRANIFNGCPIKQHHFAADTTFPPDMPVRLFRRVSNDGRSCRFYGQIHEHPELSLNEGPGLVIGLSDVNIAHVGYLNEQIRRKRFERNNPLLERDIKKYPDRMLQQFFRMRDNMLRVGYVLSQNGGTLTDDVVYWCRDTINVWREKLRGRPANYSSDPLDLYSNAVQTLKPLTGKGFETEFGFRAEKHGLNGSSTMLKRAWFENDEDRKIEMEAREEREVVGLDAKWW